MIMIVAYYYKEDFKAKLKAINNMSDIERTTSSEQWIRKRVKNDQ